MVQYWYDAWGNHKVVSANGTTITSSTHIGNVNPFRYRGYYYDAETGLYFLQTRYYDPEVGRFLNRDSVQYADPQTFGGLDLYAYCLNNPVEKKYFPVIGLTGIYETTPELNNETHFVIPGWVQGIVGVIPDIINAIKYLEATGMHKNLMYVTETLYMFPILGGTWRRFKIDNTSFNKLFAATFKQIIATDARASLGSIIKSFGGTVALTGLVNFGFNLYENEWHIDNQMLIDTAIDTAIGVSSYYLAAGTASLIVSGLGSLGLAVPGVIVVAGVVLLSAGFENFIRWITGYNN